MRAVSKKRAKQLRERRRIVERMKAAGPVICQRCGRLADDLHERLSRARGGSITDPDNLIPLCREDHDWVTTHPVEAEREGFSCSASPS